MAKSKFAEMKTEAPVIMGSSTINHASRVELGLNCSEYVLMDYVYRCVMRKREVDVLETYLQTGFDRKQQEVLLAHLVEKGFIYPKNVSPPELTDRWSSAFADIEREFEELFWRKDDKVFFTGSKKKSYGYYHKLRKKYSREFMIGQRDAYARLLALENENGFPRRVMMAERWLLEANEYYLVDWTEMGDAIAKELKSKKGTPVEKTETVTSTERKNQYEQDSNQ